MEAKIMQHASRPWWRALLDAGVEIYEYHPTMYHSKILNVNDVWVSAGSASFDDCSFRLKGEANLNLYDAAFAVAQVEVFGADMPQSRFMTRAEVENRSILDQIAGHFRRPL